MRYLLALLLFLPSLAFAQVCTTTGITTCAGLQSCVSSNTGTAKVCCINASTTIGSCNLWDYARTQYATICGNDGAGSCNATPNASLSPNLGNTDFVKVLNLTIAGASVDSCSTNLQFVGNSFGTTRLGINNNGCGTFASKYLIENNTFGAYDSTGSGLEGRLGLYDTASSSGSETIIRGNTFNSGGCSDGIQSAGASGITIGPNNIFEDLLQGSCGPHVDAIQMWSVSNVIVEENYFSNNSVSMGLYDGGSDLTIRNNIFVGSPRNMQMGDWSNVLISHNTAKNEGWEFSADPPGANSGVIIENNIFDNTDLADTQGNFCGPDCIIRYNLTSRGSTYDASTPCTPGCVTGDAVYLGGGASAPTTWAGWELDGSSPGNSAGNDGLDMGTTYYGTPAVGPSAPTNFRLVDIFQFHNFWSR